MATYIPQTFKTAAEENFFKKFHQRIFILLLFKRGGKRVEEDSRKGEFMNCLEKLSTLMAQAEHFALLYLVYTLPQKIG